MLTGCKFEYNMAMGGAVVIQYYRELWEVDSNSDPPYNLLGLHSEVITIDSCQFTGNTSFFSSQVMASGLTITSQSPVNVEIKNSTFFGNNSAWNNNGVLIVESLS